MTRRKHRPRAYRNLAAFLSETGTSQETFAERLGVSPSYVSMIAGGSRRPSLAVALRIARLAAVPIETLVAESVERRAS